MISLALRFITKQMPSFVAHCLMQVALEVHNVDGRLAATVDLLKSEPAAFDEVCWQPQITSEIQGYVMVVPSALSMFLVFAKRSRREQSAKSSSTDGGPAAVAASGATEVDCSAVRDVEREAEAGRIPRVIGGEVEGGKGGDTDTTLPEKFCSCAPLLPFSQVKK